MKQGLLLVTLFLGFLCLVGMAEGQEFDVNNPVEFQNALATAQSNNEDDTINVWADMTITTTLTYETPDGDSGRTLTINGNGYTLTGNNVQIMSINTDNNGNGGDSGGDVTIDNLRFQNGNNSAGDGGGLYVYTGQANITLTTNTFSGNTAADDGGGAYVYTSSGTATLTNNTFSGNTAAADAGGGAYVYTYSGTATLTTNTFSGNTAAAEYGGGAVVDTYSGTATLTNNTFSGNTAYDGGGAYVYTSSGTATLTNNTFSGNTADYGGGARVGTSSGTATLTNNTFSGNTAEYGGGARVGAYYDNATANIYNNIIYGNTASNDGDDLYVDSDWDGNNIGSTINLYNNDLGLDSDFVTGQSEDLYITDTDYYNQDNNISADPLLTVDFHLQAGSPCRDIGLNTAPGIPSTDFEGDQRIINGTVDIGADEYRQPQQTAVSVPTMTEWGMIVFMVCAGLMSAYYLRRRLKA